MEPTSKTPGTGRNKPQPVEGGDVVAVREREAPAATTLKRGFWLIFTSRPGPSADMLVSEALKGRLVSRRARRAAIEAAKAAAWFVELEDQGGNGARLGLGAEWVDRADGLVAFGPLAPADAMFAALERNKVRWTDRMVMVMAKQRMILGAFVVAGVNPPREGRWLTTGEVHKLIGGNSAWKVYGHWLGTLADEGWLERRPGKRKMWRLSNAGASRLAELIAEAHQ